MCIENIQRLLGGEGDRGGQEEEEGTAAEDPGEGGGLENGHVQSEKITLKHPGGMNGKGAISALTCRNGNESENGADDDLEAETTKNAVAEEDRGDGVGVRIKKSEGVKKGKPELKVPVEKVNIDGKKTDDDDFVPQKKTRKLRGLSENTVVTPASEKAIKRRTRGGEKDEGNKVAPIVKAKSRIGDGNKKSASAKNRTPGGPKDKDSPVTPTNNASRLNGKNINTPTGLDMRLVSPSTPATLEKKNKKGETSLQIAVIKGEENTVKQLLEAGACPNTRDNAGWTPLHEARGRPELVELLLKAGALPSVPAGDDRVTALHEAAASGQVEEVRLLLKHGADRDARDRMGRTPSQLAQSHAKVLLVLKNEPCMPPPTGVKPAGPTCLVSLKEDSSKLALKLGYHVMREVSEATTHLVASQDQADQVQWLAAVIVGAELVGESWLKEGGVGEEEGHRLEAEGLDISRAWRAGLQPKLLAGIHIYFKGIFSSPPKAELQMLAKLGGATVLNRCPGYLLVVC